MFFRVDFILLSNFTLHSWLVLTTIIYYSFASVIFSLLLLNDKYAMH